MKAPSRYTYILGSVILFSQIMASANEPQLSFTSIKIEERANHFAQYIHQANTHVYLRGSAEQFNLPLEDFKVLNLNSQSIINFGFKDLSEDSTVVCIEDILGDDQAYIYYETLESSYPYFLYIPGHVINSEVGVLVASQYKLAEPKYENTVASEGTNPGIPASTLRLSRSQNRGYTSSTDMFGRQALARSNCNRKSGTDYEAEFSLKINGEDPPEFDVSVSAEKHDGKGNYTEVKAAYNLNENEATVSVKTGKENK